MLQEEVLSKKCTFVTQEVSRIYDKYKLSIGDSPVVLSYLAKIVNRSREYENGTFIVLVVGPVKSGKSTLVNLIANAYVSPSHFLECTVRPSIISQRHNNEDDSILVFTSEKDIDSYEKIEQIDSIIDYIRGIVKEDSLKNIKKTKYDLTQKNIKEKVELGLQESLYDTTLVTSITTPGGKLMQNNVFIIDMPGFDGGYANIDDPTYNTISERADLIIFVQSSNSNISKVSKEFLDKLKANNRGVYVCLIQNVFDSSWWQSEKEREVNIREQKEFAIKEIREKGFSIDEKDCFSINLGKVSDSRKQEYNEPSLKKEAEVYGQIEESLYNRIISRKDPMRLNVCLKRTKQQIEKTITSIEDILKHRYQLAERYEKIMSEFATVKDIPNFVIQPLTIDYKDLKDIILAKKKDKIDKADVRHKMNLSNEDVKGIVMDFIKECEKDISSSFRRCLSLKQKEDYLYRAYKDSIDAIKEIVSKYGITPLQSNMECLTISSEEIPSISLSPCVDMRLFIPSKFRINLGVTFLGHSAEDVISYINKTANSLVGSSDNYSYIEKEDGAIRPVLDTIAMLLNEIVRKYENG